MKKIITILALSILSISTIAQTISLGVDNEYCPNVEYEFTVTLPGPYHSISATQMLITQQPNSFNQSNTSFKFKAKFNDVNIKQFVEIRYNPNGTATFKPEYKKVKSLFYTNLNSCGQIQPKFTASNLPVTSFNAPLCQVTSFNITFTAAKWFTNGETPVYCFGSIADYEYLLPANWKLGNNTSNGTAWLQGGNTVTITSDLTTGSNTTISIRPRNSCGANLSNNQIPLQIPVSRAASNPSMSASPNSIPCGSTDPITFTINAGSITGISGYTWNLGATNGWLYNGSPAPSSINTTTNTVTLTPVCGVALASPSGTITVTNAGNNCNISVPATLLTITAPTLSIQGTQALCANTENYSVLGLPCNATNIWSIEPATGIATLNSSTGQTTSLTKVADGDITLTAKATACGTEYPVSIPIHVGAYTSSDFTLTASGGNGMVNGYLPWCPNTTYGFSVGTNKVGATASNYIWSPTLAPPLNEPQGWTINYISNYLCVLKAPTSSYPPTSNISVTFTEGCGTTITKSLFLAYSPSACNGTDPRFTYSPNPAPSYLYVAVASGYTSTTKIQRIQIIRNNTATTVFDQNYGTPGVLSAYITTSGYQTGTHTLRIFDGSTWAVYQFMR